VSKRTKTILLLLPVPVILLVIAAILSITYIPAWYRPEILTIADREEILNEFVKVAEQFNQSMQRPEPFTFSISQRQVNRLIAGLDRIDPEAARSVPAVIHEPAVALEDGAIKAAAVVDYHGRQAAASVTLSLAVDEHYLYLKDLSVHVGRWPVPLAGIQEEVSRLAREKNDPGLALLERLLRERYIANRFPYGHSDYDFRIDGIRADRGDLELKITPLPRR